jgi:hypothetical protein
MSEFFEQILGSTIVTGFFRSNRLFLSQKNRKIQFRFEKGI